MIVFLSILGVAAAGALVVYGRNTGFSEVKCRIEKQGGEILVYREMDGDYSETAKLMWKLCKELKEKYNLKIFRGVCVYYDDPKSLEKSRLRFDVGCIIEMPEPDLLQELNKSYLVKRHPEKSYLVSERPYRRFLSTLFGIRRIYPAFERFQHLNKFYIDGPVMEICDKSSGIISYRKDIS